MIKLIKPNTEYITRYININYIYSKIPICCIIKDIYKKSQAWILKSKYSLKISRLRLNILLYGKFYPDNKEILETTKYNLRIYLELVLIISTKLAIPGVWLITIDFYDTIRNIGKISFWISKEELIQSIKSLYDYILIKDYNKIISLDI